MDNMHYDPRFDEWFSDLWDFKYKVKEITWRLNFYKKNAYLYSHLIKGEESSLKKLIVQYDNLVRDGKIREIEAKVKYEGNLRLIHTKDGYSLIRCNNLNNALATISDIIWKLDAKSDIDSIYDIMLFEEIK